ncbi:MAG TPA: tetratricopeptide repeat protein [Planctomycetaceae bacterium]|nr:tetratricopeptide repeat protein [Planctomycetaceae bacterium]
MTTKSRSWTARWPWGLVFVLGCAAAYAWRQPRAPQLPQGVEPQQYQAANDDFQQRYGRPASRIEVLSLLAERAVHDERLPTAVACFREIPSTQRVYGPSARLQEAQVLLRLNRALEAERSFREFLSLAERNPAMAAPSVATARKWLLYILSVELRLEERKTLLAEIHAQGAADLFDSKQFFFPNLLIFHSTTGRERLAEFLREAPDDPQLLVAQARYLTMLGKLDESQRLLEPLCQERPNDRTASAALLECYFEQNDQDRFRQLARALPAERDEEPWLLMRMRGQFLLQQRRWHEAVAQFQRLLAQDPANPWANMGLARAYEELQEAPARDETQRKSLVLSRIRLNLKNVNDGNVPAIEELADACDQIDFTDAAAVFRQHAQRFKQAPAATR